ncbi:MAG: hypothetical protein Kapaf2KO_14390 [Candidatus Kapaibacteriales bacterium]
MYILLKINEKDCLYNNENQMKYIKFVIASFISISFTTISYSETYVKATPAPGEGISMLLKRYRLDDSNSSISTFKKLNKLDNNRLGLGRNYYLPIQIYKYNGTSIRSTVGNNDYDYALTIQKYNELTHQLGLKEKDYRTDNILWVPITIFDLDEESMVTEKTVISVKQSLLGKKYEEIKIEDHKLKGKTFYLVSGHGGPDPGAIGSHRGKELHEDEYAYDVILRLGRNLISRGAKVHFIIQDPDDGIRDDEILNNSKNETCLSIQIPMSQKERLYQRVDAINALYDLESDPENHHFISIHVDSRARKDSQIDIFFYHAEGSQKGQDIANTLRDMMEKKYKAAQPNRGYEGSVSTRNLYVIRKTKPVCTFIELGNIQNERDKLRIIKPDNRQAIANWLTDGLIQYWN